MKSSTERTLIFRGAALLALVVLLAACTSTRKQLTQEKLSATHVALAQELYKQERMQGALRQVHLALQKWQENPEAWFVRGQVHVWIREYARAVEDFSTALQYRSGFAEYLSWRALAHVMLENPDAAERDYMEALQDTTYMTPEKIYLNLGLLEKRRGRETEGLEYLEKAVTVNPAYSRGHYELGKTHDEAGNLSKAVIAYEAALGGLRDLTDLNLRLGIVLDKMGEGHRAKQYLQRVIELAPDGPEAETARTHLQRIGSAS